MLWDIKENIFIKASKHVLNEFYKFKNQQIYQKFAKLVYLKGKIAKSFNLLSRTKCRAFISAPP